MPSAHDQAMNCDALAPFYNFLEHATFGWYLERARFAYLSETRHARRALLCGDGDGRFLARLLQINPHVEIDFVDLSPKMIELADRRASSLGPAARDRVRFHAVDVRFFAPPRSAAYDLIAAHFFLDCFTDEELPAVVPRLAGWSAGGAKWLVSEFREAPSAPARQLTRGIIRALYAAFRVTTNLRATRLPNYSAALARQNLILQSESLHLAGLLHSSLWQS